MRTEKNCTQAHTDTPTHWSLRYLQGSPCRNEWTREGGGGVVPRPCPWPPRQLQGGKEGIKGLAPPQGETQS